MGEWNGMKRDGMVWSGMGWNKGSTPLFGYQTMELKEVFTSLFGNTMEGDGIRRILNYLLLFCPISPKLEGENKSIRWNEMEKIPPSSIKFHLIF